MRRSYLWPVAALLLTLVVLVGGEQLPHRGWWIVASLAVGGAVAVMRAPALAAFGVVLLAGVAGGPLILLAAPAVLLLGHRATRGERGRRHRAQRLTAVAVAAVLVGLATLPFAALAYGPRNPQGAGGGGATGQPRMGASPATGSGGLARIVDAIARLLDGDHPGNGAGSAQPGRSGGGAPPEPDSNLWPWVLVAVVVVLVLALVTWFLVRWIRRRRGRGPGVQAAWSLARLEAVGRRVGRRRAPSEGVLAYADALAARTGDDRLGHAGPAISGHVYESATASPAGVESSLVDLERRPPPRPPRRRVRNAWRRVRAYRPSRRTLAALAVVVLACVWAVPKLTTLGRPAGRDGAWSALWSEPADRVERWASCTTLGGTSVARAGVDDVSEERYATATATPTAAAGDRWVTRQLFAEGQASYDQGTGWYELGPVPMRAWRPFADVGAVVEAFGLEEAPTSSLADPTGRPFTRYEVLPVDTSDGPAPFSEVMGAGMPGVVSVLDVWLDGTGRPQRLRQQLDGDDGWAEWRRLDSASSDPTPPGCTRGSTAEPAEGWFGSAPWTKTLSVPVKVAFDAAGYPYEPGWAGTDAGPWTTVAEVVAPGRTVAVTSADALVPEWGEAQADHHDVPVQPGTHIVVESMEGPDAPVASRLRLGASVPIVRWRSAGELDVGEALVGLHLSATRFDDADDLSSQLDALWRSGDPVAGSTLDIDDDGRDDLLVLEPYGGYGEVFVGVDARGTVREVVITWSGTPWRLLGLSGDAPASVVAREAQLRACLEGTRPVGIDGTCTTDEG